jgi:hypothetical protein
MTAAEESKRQGYVDQAIEALEKSIEAGFGNIVLMKTDADLEALRTPPNARFERLIQELEEKSKTSGER